MTNNGEVVIKTFVLKVYIHCEGCKKKVKKVLQNIEGVLTTTIDAPEQKVTVTGNVASAEILVKTLIKARKHAEEWKEPQNNLQKDIPKDKEKVKTPPPPPKQKEKEKKDKDQEKEKKDKDKEKEKKAAKVADAEEVSKKGDSKNGGGSGEGAKKSEDPEETSGIAPVEGNTGAGGESSSSASGGSGKKKKGGKGGGGGGEATNAEPSSEAPEFPSFSPVGGGDSGGYGHMSGGGYGDMNGRGYGHMNGVGYGHMSQPQPILQYQQYAPPNAHSYTYQSAHAPVQSAAYQFNDEYPGYHYNDENAAYAFNDENTGSCSVM